MINILKFIFVLLFFFAPAAFAVQEGPNNCATPADDATVGTVTWGTTASGCGADVVYTTASLPGVAESHYFKVTNFNFSVIPNGALVLGIEVNLTFFGNTNGANNVDEDHIKLVKAGTIQTADKATAGLAWPTVATTTIYGSSSDLWSTTWTPADIRDSTFGVVISAVGHTASGNKTVVASIDNVSIRVTYSAGIRGVFGTNSVMSTGAIAVQ